MRSKHISGRSLCGFFGLFEADYGDPETETPMRTITPSFVGSSMLPFRCPRCKEVAQDLVCLVTREHYRDKRAGRDNHFCPDCGCRFRIDMTGMSLPCAIPAGAAAGPSKVECGGRTEWQDRAGSTLLGVVFGTLLGSSSKNGYLALVRRAHG